MIKEAHGNHDMSTIFLFGDLAVPYSGDVNPDAHGDHRGAWPADGTEFHRAFELLTKCVFSLLYNVK
jgi:hypothetical protein